MKYFWFMVVWMVAGVAAEAAALVVCPDCGGNVSARAVFCPHCGAPGEAIAEVAAETEAGEAGETPEVEGEAEEAAEEVSGDSVLFARVNGRDVYALPVAWPDGPCAILPAAALAGLETLELIQPSTALPVPYGAPAVSRDGRLVRLPLSGGVVGIAFHPLARAAGDGFVFDPGSIPPEETAPVAAVRVPEADDVSLSAAILWQTVSPRALKSILNQKEPP